MTPAPVAVARNTKNAAGGKVFYGQGGTIMMRGHGIIQETTRRFSEELALRGRYQREGFGLESAFEKREMAEARVVEIKRGYHLTSTHIRLVQHTYILQMGERTMWEVYVKAGKGLKVLFPK